MLKSGREQQQREKEGRGQTVTVDLPPVGVDLSKTITKPRRTFMLQQQVPHFREKTCISERRGYKFCSSYGVLSLGASSVMYSNNTVCVPGGIFTGTMADLTGVTVPRQRAKVQSGAAVTMETDTQRRMKQARGFKDFTEHDC